MNWKRALITLVIILSVLGMVYYAVSLRATDQLVIENKTQQKKIILTIPADKTLEISYIHSLYGGIQIESFKTGEDKLLHLQKMKFENYDALLYYVCYDVIKDYYEEPYWVIDSDYVTDSVNFLLPMTQREFKVRLSNRVVTGEEIGTWGDIIKIYLK